MGSTAYEFYKYENTMAISDIRTSLWSGFSIKSTSLKRDLWEAVLLLPFFLGAHPGCVSATSCSIPHQSAARPGSCWGCKMEWKDHVSESQTGPVSTPALLLTRSVRRVRSSPKCSKCQVFITCVAVAQISLFLLAAAQYWKHWEFWKVLFKVPATKCFLLCPLLSLILKGRETFLTRTILENLHVCHSSTTAFCVMALVPSVLSVSSLFISASCSLQVPAHHVFFWTSTSQSSPLPRGNSLELTKYINQNGTWIYLRNHVHINLNKGANIPCIALVLS